ncbi:MAG: polysaccharide biosynthesis protein [Eubacteriales bacterium]|nr:polysaccharide biosynthesis protein [Eubacteriales bacterium]
MTKENKQTFMNNVAIILFAQFAVKLLGLFYRIFLFRIDGFGDLANGYYSAGFNIYTLLLALSSVGIPNAISKMTAERIALGDRNGAHRIFRTALVLFSFVGLVCTCLILFGADWIANELLLLPGAKYVLVALSPSILFVCVSSVIRGYFNGMKNMKASSNSQILEQVFKCLFTIGIVAALAAAVVVPQTEEGIHQKAQILAAGANFATSIATVFSLLYLFIFYQRRKNAIFSAQNEDSCKTIEGTFFSVCKSILLISIPISLGSIIAAINRIVDTATITRGIYAAFADYIPAHGDVAAISNPTFKQLEIEAGRLSGMLGKSDTLLNLPIALNIAFATVLVPSLSGALAVGNTKEASEKVSLSLLISILIILPCAVGYITLAEPIFKLLYPEAPDGYQLLILSSIALIFIALNQTISGSLQGCGKVYAPATGLFIGCIVKFILNVILIRIPQINIFGAPIGSIVCQIISFSYGFTVLRKSVPVKLPVIKYISKPVTASIIMAISAIMVYTVLYRITAINIVSLLIAIFIAIIVYFASVIALKILSENEIEQLPAGNMLLRAAKKTPFYR